MNCVSVIAMKIKRLALAVWGVSVGMFVQPAFAQQTTVNPLQDFQTRDNGAPLIGNNGQKTMLDLIHQSQLGQFNVDYNAVEDQRRQNINDAAAQFRARQRQLMQPDQQPQNPNNSTSGNAPIQPAN